MLVFVGRATYFGRRQVEVGNTGRTVSMDILRRCEAGEVILRENDVGETTYVIEHGRVEVSRS